MRIQHNILAMNAYRNYNTNTSALAKNLEKLSSGYKINRAGDDAAGLAISEKMRAQIKGLEAAQKNVKDGTSLVKTAEGAMQEIQDMLGRMKYLATQSSNGTYDNEVDRKALQDEVEQLKSEINRIADSANFNGIKLLDGSLDTNADLTTKMDFTVGKDLPGVGETLGVDTILHKSVADPDSGSKFSIDLHDYEFNNQKGDTMKITIGDTKIEITSTAAHTEADGSLTKMTGDDLVDTILAGTAGDYTVKVNGQQFNQGDKIVINGQDFTIEKGDSDARINFSQDNPPTDKSEEVDPSMKVTIGGKISAVSAKYEFTLNATTAGLTTGSKIMLGDEELEWATDLATTLAKSTKFDTEVNGNTVTLTAKSTGPMEAPEVSYKNAATNTAAPTATLGTDGTMGVYEIDGLLTGESVKIGGKTFSKGTDYSGANAVDVEIDGITYSVAGNLNTGAKLTITEKTNSDGLAVASGGGTIQYTKGGASFEAVATTDSVAGTKASDVFDISGWTGGELNIKGVKIAWNGVDAESSVREAIKAGKLNFENYEFSISGTDLTMTAKKAGAAATTTIAAGAAGDVKIANGADVKVTTTQKGVDLQQDPQTGDYNVSTTVISRVTAADKERLASTYFDLTADMVTDGSKLTIADQTFTFTTNEELIGEEGYVDATSGDLDQIAKNLTKAAEKNHVYTVGHDGNRISVTETLAHAAEYKVDANTGVVKGPADGWDLRTADGIAKSLGFTAGETKTGKALQLQIGDTSDAYNMLKVSVSDMHTSALGIADLDISNPEAASDAIQTVMNAINSVSSTRGTLGAIQNRLDHTSNNLSVMVENITDAESTIRDTDVAEEMMAYTKNNILVQSAQAMLAQANAVPQGVLQLLG